MQTRAWMLLALHRVAVSLDAPAVDDVPQSVFNDECDMQSGACDVSLLQRRALQAQSVEEAVPESDGDDGPPEDDDDVKSEEEDEEEEEPEPLEKAQVVENRTEAPTFEFYVYRSMSYKEWPLGNINVANLDGVMWYLTNEVLPRCPKRYNITQIKRFKITTKATPELFARGMNFGVRYSYDAGKCTGSNTIKMGPCNRTWDRFGYVVGCNNFRSRYPWPVVPTAYPKGIWYDLPMEGRCDQPTGAWNCTWSYEEAGHVLLEEELEHKYHGPGYYCHHRHSKFWNNQLSRKSGSWRVRKVKELFVQKYPDMPHDLTPPKCDFHKEAFWAK